MPAVTPTLIMGVLGIVLSAPAWVLFIRAARRLYLFIAAGQPAPGRTNRPLRRGVQVLKEVFFHTELMRRPAIAVAHWFVMVGFLIGSLVWFEAYIQTFNPAGGWPLLSQWSLYHFAEEVLAIGTVLGIGFLFAIRLSTGMRERLSRFYGSNALSAFFVEGVIFLEGAGMLLVKAGKIATYGHASPWADFLTQYLAQFLPASPIMVSAFALFKLLVGMVWLVVVARNLTWGVAWHRFLAFFNIFFQRNPDGAPALGKVLPLYDGTTELTIDTIEEDSSLGIGHLQDASWKMLLDAATCTECGRCQTQCPSWNTGKPLSPKLFVTDIRDAAVANASYLQDPDTFATDTTYSDVDLLKLVGESNVIHPDVLWSCTNCGACVEQCPVDIEHIDHVVNMRRFQVLAESDFPSELVGMFKNLEVKGNPWGRNNAERASWITEARRDGIEVPVFGEDAKSFDDIEYLFWVGCAGAFDDDGKRTTRAVVELLHTAGVKFAVLSKAERCTGDPARRAGNEFLFQQLALENIDTLNGVFSGVPKGQRKIITTCPHCFNTFRNEYPDFDGYFDVFHHTQLLNRLVRDKLLTPIPRGPKDRKPITYHDPCFLGRHNKVFDPPRELLGATGADLVEMPRNRNEGFCCGAGGARMFMEENLGTRINENRAAEAVATGAAEIAVGCPFCNTMMVSGVKAVADATPAPAVRDVAQMLRDSVLVDGHLPDPRPKQFLQPPIREKREEKPEPKPAGKSAKPQASPAKPASPTTVVRKAPQPGVSPVVAPPGAAKPAVPGAAAPGAAIPGSAVPPAPGAAIPGGAMPPAATPPGAKPPTARPATPGAAIPGAAVPGVAKPAAPGAARPGAAIPPAATPPGATPPGGRPATPTPPGTAVPGIAMPGSVVPPAATPKATPPKAAPPTAQPPVARPPAATAPTAPAAPGGSVPKTVAPGATIPGTARPPAAKPPAPTPPTAKPPAAVPPVAKPPTATPPGAMPPGSRPAASPVAKPPAAKPPVAQPPVAKPPVAKPPMAKPPMVPPSKDISQDTDKDQEQP
ncbi:heterodisulfide reductase-related iron-sulfur binding cluster [Corynebacterium matruchotii]|uniref:heterodisulfide reductase-related iron-sulfur binding cluster n=1 Tax=Corynebacterium matruchotii TaxID=43768 RepID=UPI0028E774E0|nr:heterodisulfide reductase-related iron-sulfur binding cluster [Corynebacterium matruchotii]